MPRYRFRWELVPDDLRRSLAEHIGLPGEPEQGLRRRYGARPGVGFVKDHWPVLRDQWLSHDASARKRVVDELRQLRLGQWEILPDTDEYAYLGSCRNTVSLQAVVLTAFHDLGSSGGAVERAEPDGAAS